MSRGRERPKVYQPDPEAVKKGAPTTRRKGYLKEDVPVLKHRPGQGTNRFRFFAWSDVASFIYYLFVHRGVGPNEDSFVCMAQQQQKPCAVCEDIRAQMNQGVTAKQINEQGLWPRTRLLIQGVDRHEEEKGIQVADFPEYKIDDAIVAMVQDDVTGEVLPVCDPEKGFDALWDYDPQDKYPMPENIRLSRTATPISVDFYDQIREFDELVHFPTYDEVKEAYFAGLPSTATPSGEEPETTPEEPTPEEPTPEEPAAEEPAAEEPAAEEQTTAVADPGEDCFGKDFGNYPKDCLPEECLDHDKCKEAFEKGKEPEPEKEEDTPRAPRRRRS